MVWLRVSKHIPCLRVLIDACGWRCVVQVLEDEFSSRPHLGNLHGQHHAARTLLSRQTSDVQQCRRLDCASICSEVSNGVGKMCSSDNPRDRPSTCPPGTGQHVSGHVGQRPQRTRDEGRVRKRFEGGIGGSSAVDEFGRPNGKRMYRTDVVDDRTTTLDFPHAARDPLRYREKKRISPAGYLPRVGFRWFGV